MSSPGGKGFQRVQSARLEARKLVQEDIADGLLTSSSQEEIEDEVDLKVEYVLEAESLLDAQEIPESRAAGAKPIAA